MNENNQPQSQQTKRERGLYHVKRNGYWTVAEYTDHHGQWRVFNNTDQMQSRDFEEIDERRIERSHSPTEQPGDAKHTWKVGGTNENYGNLRQYSTAVFDEIECVGRSMAFTYEESRQRAQLIARAPALLSEVSTLRSKQAELVAELKAVNEEWAAHLEYHKTWVEKYHAQSAELEQLRSERDKMREALKISKSWVSQITNVYLEEGRAKIVSIIESALSGGSKQ